jgi:uncharacterized protein (UPF0332 family)
VCDWDDFLDLAERLAAKPSNEAAARSAISRAHYAAFHAGHDYLVRAGIPLDRTRNAHRQVQVELRKSVEIIGRDLERLHTWRKQADYDNPIGPDVIDVAMLAAFAVSLSRQTIIAIDAIP